MKLTGWLMAVQWILIGLLGLSTLAPRSDLLSWARLPGAVIALLGLALVVLPIRTYVSVNRSVIRAIPEPDPSATLVDRGLYSYIRHPVYLGVILGSSGLGLFWGSFWSLAIAGFLTIFYYMKSLYEERLLIQAFPEYASYRRRTGRFLPRLSRTKEDR